MCKPSPVVKPFDLMTKWPTEPDSPNRIDPDEGPPMRIVKCRECGEVHEGCPTPNRFDPYEALDTIIERVDDIEEQLHEPRDPMACIGRLADISGEVRALRAYITGMER